MISFSLPIIGFVGASGSGKTTLIEKLIPLLNHQGLRLAVIKHSHHPIELDKPGKDSYRFSQAGSYQTMLASSHGWTLMSKAQQPENEPDLAYLLNQLDSKHLDLVLVEGFKQQSFSKIEVVRAGHIKKPVMDNDIIAVCTDDLSFQHPSLPVLDLNDPDTMLTFLLETTALDK